MSWSLRGVTISKSVYLSVDDLIIGFSEDLESITDNDNLKNVLKHYINEFKRVKKEFLK